MNYSTIGFIATLKPEKRRFTTYLIDPISQASYGYIFRLWPITVMKIMGWHGETFTARSEGVSGRGRSAPSCGNGPTYNPCLRID